jgi:hypothetical protein
MIWLSGLMGGNAVRMDDSNVFLYVERASTSSFGSRESLFGVWAVACNATSLSWARVLFS